MSSSNSTDLGEEDSYTENEYLTSNTSSDEEQTEAAELEVVEEDKIGALTDLSKGTLSKQEQVLKAHISILTSALGGVDYSSDSEKYKLGDDALACLKDIKRWLKSVDELERKWDVALACAETNLVVNDLIVILSQWEADCMSNQVKNKNYMERIALSILELLVPLTWPLRITRESTPNQVDHYQNLKKAQLVYKKLILTFQGGKALRAVVRLTLPIISKPKSERTGREIAILRLCIYFFRNILRIEPANSTVSSKSSSKTNQVLDNFPTGVTAEDVSLNAVIDSYNRNNILDYLLTITNMLGSDLDEEMLSAGCLECLYHLIDGVDFTKMFIPTIHQDSVPHQSKKTETLSAAHLQELLAKENSMKKNLFKSSSSRHGRFGTLLSLQTIDNGRLTISGQKGLSDRASTLAQLDESKSWRPSKAMIQTAKFNPSTELDEKLGQNSAEKFLSEKSTKIMIKFIDSFIEGCLDSVSRSSRRRLLSAEDPSLNTLQYFDFITWILGYETEKRIADDKNTEHANGFFVSILEDEFFTLVITSMRKSFEKLKLWSLVESCLRCFKQVLAFAELIRTTSSTDFDQEMSFNVIQRLFMVDSTLDLFAEIPRNAYKISSKYVSTVVEFVYVVLKTLEKFSKNDETLYVTSKKGRRAKKNPEQNYSDSEEEEIASHRIKALDFNKYQQKFIHRDTIQTHISLFERYQEISEQDLKRCLAFFYRVFYTAERHLDLYRLDFMIMLQQMTGNGPKALSSSSKFKRELISFTKYYMKKMISQLEKSPSLLVQLCFYSSAWMDHRLRYFLEHGQVLKELKTFQVAREIFFKNGYEIDTDRKFAIIVSLMIDQGERKYVEIVKEEVSRIIDSRNAWLENQRQLNIAEGNSKLPSELDLPVETFNTKDENVKKQLLKNARLRLLLKTIGFSLCDVLDETCELSSDVDLDHLTLDLSSITKYLTTSVQFPAGVSAADYIAKNMEYDEEYEGDAEINYGRNAGYEEDENDIAFETNAFNLYSNTVTDLDRLDELENRISIESSSQGNRLGHARRKKVKGSKQQVSKSHKKTKSKRNRHERLAMHDISDIDEPDPRRLTREHEYKSSEFIQDSDDEEDNEFFEKEQFLRKLLELNDGVLKPEHAILFTGDAWKSYKITAVGELSKKNVLENEDTQETQLSQFYPLSEQSQAISISQNVSERASQNLSQDQYNSSGEDSDIVSESTTNDNKRSAESLNEGEDSSEDEGSEGVKRKKVKRVIESDDDDD